jgi:hypothetical protein
LAGACASALFLLLLNAQCSQPAMSQLPEQTLFFLEVALHSILFARRVYPAPLFERRSAFGMPVWMCRAPELAAAVGSLLSSLQGLLERNAVEAFVVALLAEPGGSALEQYSFSLNLRTPGLPVPASFSDADSMFSAAVRQLQALEAERSLPPLPASATWTVLLDTHDLLRGPPEAGPGAAALGADSPWLRVDSGDSAAALLQRSQGPGRCKRELHIKSIRLGALSLNVSLELAA